MFFKKLDEVCKWGQYLLLEHKNIFSASFLQYVLPMTWAASWQLWWLHALMLGMGEKRFCYNLEWWQKAWVGHFRPPYAIFSRLELIDPFFTTREVNLFRLFLWKNSPPCNFYSCALYGITMIVYINHFPFSALSNALLYCTRDLSTWRMLRWSVFFLRKLKLQESTACCALSCWLNGP